MSWTAGDGGRYVKGSTSEPVLVGLSDSDFAGDIDDRKSNTGVVFFLDSDEILRRPNSGEHFLHLISAVDLRSNASHTIT